MQSPSLDHSQALSAINAELDSLRRLITNSPGPDPHVRNTVTTLESKVGQLNSLVDNLNRKSRQTADTLKRELTESVAASVGAALGAILKDTNAKTTEDVRQRLAGVQASAKLADGILHGLVRSSRDALEAHCYRYATERVTKAKDQSQRDSDATFQRMDAAMLRVCRECQAPDPPGESFGDLVVALASRTAQPVENSPSTRIRKSGEIASDALAKIDKRLAETVQDGEAILELITFIRGNGAAPKSVESHLVGAAGVLKHAANTGVPVDEIASHLEHIVAPALHSLRRYRDDMGPRRERALEVATLRKIHKASHVKLKAAKESGDADSVDYWNTTFMEAKKDLARAVDQYRRDFPKGGNKKRPVPHQK